jgi:hypothetical protein
LATKYFLDVLLDEEDEFFFGKGFMKQEFLEIVKGILNRKRQFNEPGILRVKNIAPYDLLSLVSKRGRE